MADVVGIIAAGRLVREGTIQELLNAEGVVRVRVAPERGRLPLRAALGLRSMGQCASRRRRVEPGWLSVRITPDRTGEVNRVLGEAGIWASGLESGNDLEMLFLALTGGHRRRRAARARCFGTAGDPPGAGASGTGDAS